MIFALPQLTSVPSIFFNLAAGVPGLGKNWLMNNDGNSYFLTRAKESSKSSGVSVGKAQMKSVAM